jgi:2-dehydro-3-deoxyglucarate aldolase
MILMILMMNRIKKIKEIRNKLSNDESSIGSWMQIPNSSIAEIMGQSGYDWIAVDMEHGSIDINQLPDVFRALELGNTLPLARLSEGSSKNCKQVLDAGAGGVIIPMVESADELEFLRDSCRWPPAGRRGVGFSRANLFGSLFKEYSIEAQSPLLIAMIESIKAVNNLEDILKVSGLDAIFIGPYDLSASLGITGKFDHSNYLKTIDTIRSLAQKYSIPCGIHIVEPNVGDLHNKINEKYQFIAYSIDSVILSNGCKNPII